MKRYYYLNSERKHFLLPSERILVYNNSRPTHCYTRGMNLAGTHKTEWQLSTVKPVSKLKEYRSSTKNSWEITEISEKEAMIRLI